MKRVTLFVFATLFCLCFALFPRFVQAQSDAPAAMPWRGVLSCLPAERVFRGVEYCTVDEGKIHVIVVDAHSPDVQLEYVIAHGLDKSGSFGECNDVNIPAHGRVRGGCADQNDTSYYPVISLGKAVSLAAKLDNPLAAVINSDYGAGTQGEPGEFRGHGPEGLTVVHGKRLDGPANGDPDDNATRRPWLAISEHAPLQVELGQFGQEGIFPRGADHGGEPADWVYTGVGGGPWLIRAGAIQEDDIRICKNTRDSCYEGAKQTAVGLSQDRRWLYFVIDLRKGELLDLAAFMANELAVYNAIKFDGGGSSQLWWKDRVVEDGGGRQLSQYLAIFAEPGSGIEVAPPSQPSSGEDGLWEGFQQAAEKWWNEQWARAQRSIERQLAEWQQSIEQWWQEQQQKMIDEAERQIDETMGGLCGGNALLGGMVAVALIGWRRKRKG